MHITASELAGDEGDMMHIPPRGARPPKGDGGTKPNSGRTAPTPPSPRVALGGIVCRPPRTELELELDRSPGVAGVMQAGLSWRLLAAGDHPKARPPKTPPEVARAEVGEAC